MGELIVNGIKWAFLLSVSFVVMVAISTFLDLITTIVFHNVIGEILGLVGCFLPFDPSAVFGAFSTACSAILSFMVAQKIYNLTSANVSI